MKGEFSLKIIITGPRGKMGRLISQAAAQREDMLITAGVAPKGRDYIGYDVGAVAGIGRKIDAEVVDDLEKVIQASDLIIDYSTVECAMEVMKSAYKYKKAVVCGTTGFTDKQFEYIRDISSSIPILYAANTSRLVSLMYKILETTSEVIAKYADIEIVEMHDRFKMDAPSGTSKEMGQIIAGAVEKEFKNAEVYGRKGEGARDPNSIGFHSIRAGDIPSSHKVIFGLMGERLEIAHHAHNWECFAQGACEAAAFLIKKTPGLYSMKDVLRL